MHQSNMRLLLVGLITYLAWGTSFAPVVYAGLIVLLSVWFWWASSGMTARRKLQLATWGDPVESSIHSKLSLDATKVNAYIKEKREKTKKHITITHIVGKAVALALRKAPGLNGRILMDRFIQFESIDISFLAMLEGGKNLAKVKVESTDKKSVEQIATELEAGSTSLRKGTDQKFKKTMAPLAILPTWLVRIVVNIAAYAAGGLGLSVPALGLEPFPFGTAVITSVGMLGVDEAYAPFTPFARVPILILIGAMHRGVVVKEDDKLEVIDKLKLCCTIDHRFLDGAQGAELGKVVRAVFDDPTLLDQE